MQPALLAPPLRSRLDPRLPEFEENRASMLAKLAEIDRLLDEAAAGGGPEAHARLAQRGKLPVRERVALALDPDSPFLEISPLAAYDSDYTIGGGALLGIGVIAGVECVIFANDPTVLGGALTPYAGKKWMRALEIARDNHLPYVSFVESAGADLRVQASEGGAEGARRRRPARTTHFADYRESALTYGIRLGFDYFAADNVAIGLDAGFDLSGAEVFVNDFVPEDSDLSTSIGLRFLF